MKFELYVTLPGSLALADRTLDTGDLCQADLKFFEECLDDGLGEGLDPATGFPMAFCVLDRNDSALLVRMTSEDRFDALMFVVSARDDASDQDIVQQFLQLCLENDWEVAHARQVIVRPGAYVICQPQNGTLNAALYGAVQRFVASVTLAFFSQVGLQT